MTLLHIPSIRKTPMVRVTGIGALAYAALLLGGCGDHPPQALDVKPQGGRIILTGATVVDVRAGNLQGPVDLTLDQGKIVAITPSGSPPAGEAAHIVNVAGKFVVPGFNDMHAHVLGTPDPTGPLALMLANGITGFRQMQGSALLLQQRRNGTLPLFRQAPALLALPGEPLLPLNAGTVDDAVAAVRQQKQEGADFIKVVMVSPPAFLAAQKEAKRLGLPFAGHIPPGTDALPAIRGGMKSIEHMGPGAALLIPASADQNELQHMAAALPPLKAPPKWLPFKDAIGAFLFKKTAVNPLASVSDDTIRISDKALATVDPRKFHALAQTLAASGTWQVPTLIRGKTMAMGDAAEFRHDPHLRYMPSKTVDLWNGVAEDFSKLSPAAKHTLRSSYAMQLRMVKAFDEAGVKMLVGTDFGGGWLVPGFSIHQEFDELAKAGLPPLRILQMTTIDPAEFLGKTLQMGTVEAGKAADLVILDKNPLTDAKNLHHIHAVVRRGDYYSPAALRQLLEQARRLQPSQ
ncbi:amidohydrolase family protein [Sphingobium fluviale]|uniref:Amidohydrolase-related domain-containing protein n=1 Tax=Sphingobium fluviale TaxID=2506423 RepID=A0A4Q1KG80_9SPHN|nr:amidohydrolase family protein [Sphingobium fluviale]RXR28537.1 hypothetical protein EQG66_09065 [Sphingobium fluviale]